MQDRASLCSTFLQSYTEQILSVVGDRVRRQRPDTSRTQLRESETHGLRSFLDGIAGSRARAGWRYSREHVWSVGDPSKLAGLVEGGAEAAVLVHEAPRERLGAGPDPSPGHLFQSIWLQPSTRSDALLKLIIE